VARALDNAGLTGDRLKIEITETVLMENPEGIARMLGTLRERGVGISLDDFGTGFSSFSYLQRFPIDELKIDRAFVSRIGSDDASGAILKAMVDLAETLGMNAVAEGIETADQARELRRLGCAFGQGYYFSPPQPAEQITRLASIGYQPTA
jgi:diguanylate cyclase